MNKITQQCPTCGYGELIKGEWHCYSYPAKVDPHKDETVNYGMDVECSHWIASGYDGVKFSHNEIQKMAIAHLTAQEGFTNLLRETAQHIMNNQYAKQVKVNKRDILTSGIEIEKARIVGCGPNLNQCDLSVPDEGLFVIVCNKAIEKADGLWLCLDKEAQDCEWFRHHINLRRMTDTAQMCCFPLHSLGKYKPEYSMHIAPCFPSQHTNLLYKNVLLNGATVAGVALQIAYHLGAKEIELCGIDMGGDTYFDGSPTQGHHTWDTFTTRMNSFIRVVKHNGCDVYSSSDTALDVEVRKS